MGLFKNEAKRSSDDVVIKRGMFVGIVIFCLLCFIIVSIYLLTNYGTSNNLSGDALGNSSGDFNGDGKVTLTDADLTLKASVQLLRKVTSGQIKRADMNGDGRLNADDAGRIMRKAEGLLGDVNGDNKASAGDSDLVLRATEKLTTFSSSQTKLADIDCDGSVTVRDARLILIKTRSGNSIVKGYRYGDVNKDGKLTGSDVELILKATVKLAKLDAMQMKLSDVNIDGRVTIEDARIISNIISNSELSTYKYEKGDINKDGIITEEDTDLILGVPSQQASLDAVQKKLADIDEDGKVTSKDAKIINRMVDGLDGATVDIFANNNTAINKSIQGDVNGDGAITNEDAEMVVKASAQMVSLSAEQQKRAEIDLDGKITSKDARLILRLANSVVSNKAFVGDVNSDGKITQEDGQTTLRTVLKSVNLNDIQKRRADIDGDRKITVSDVRTILRLSNKISLTSKYEVGDVNKNGVINATDAQLVLKALAKSITLDSTQKKLADVDGDGNISTKDARLIIRLSSATMK